MWWRIYFWVIALISFLAFVLPSEEKVLNFYIVVLDNVLSVFYLFGLYLYIFNRTFLSQKFWFFFFWFNTIYLILGTLYETLGHIEFFSFLSFVKAYDMEPAGIVVMFFILLFVFPLYFALYQLSQGKVRDMQKKQKLSFRFQYRPIKLQIKPSKVSFNPINKLKTLSKWKKILLSVILSILLIIVIYTISFNAYLKQVEKQLPDLERKLDAYLWNQSQEEYQKAYYLFSTEYTDYEDLEIYTKKSRFLRPEFSDYLRNSLMRESFFVRFGQPLTLEYEGYLFYENRQAAPVIATFIWNHNTWELLGVNVRAPYSRFDQFNPPQKKITPTP